jgi:hypothetical protein
LKERRADKVVKDSFSFLKKEKVLKFRKSLLKKNKICIGGVDWYYYAYEL